MTGSPSTTDPRTKRRHSSPSDQRSEFQRDRDRILYSDALRRLQGVTQVVSADEGWIFHNRLTHSLKVAQVARRIAEHLLSSSKPSVLKAVGSLDADVAEAAGLAHDLGHPPFGHVAEYRLQILAGDSHFEGNAQSFRIVTQLEPHGEEYPGLDLTKATLNAVLKYPWPRTEENGHINKKYGFYSPSESQDFSFAREVLPKDDRMRSVEAEIMDLADDITFAIHDTVDFYCAGMIPLHNLTRPSIRQHADEFSALLENIKARWISLGRFRESAWQQHVTALEDVLDLIPVTSHYQGFHGQRVQLRQAMAGLIRSYVLDGIRLNSDYQSGSRRVVIDSDIERQLRMLKELVWAYVIERPSLASQQHGHCQVIDTLFDYFLRSIGDQQLSKLPPQFHARILSRNVGEETDRRLAADMICTLTDASALALYRRISGADPGKLRTFEI